ncbi:hypothetical protein GCM10009552_12530 [Rothia nasimurium]|uniref:Uncharacterized protein n=1 Tax=Luteibacter anthropi TaxID=564369 RepID=A0A7X5ZIY3_9GAMM|nr:hypothetical protein [Luteibacter anthropi]NII07160.1 hypothetical protein [Luteibacter anthropi]
MNPNTPAPSDDDLPDEHDLAGLYARLPRTEPDPALDAAVLAAAKAATPRRRPRWPLALGSAAVLVLAAGLAWQLRETQPVYAPPPVVMEKSPSREEAPATVAAPPPAVDEVTNTSAAPVAPTRRAARTPAPVARKSVHTTAPAMESMAPYSIAPAPPVPPAPPAPPSPAEPPAPGEVRTYVAAPRLKLDNAPALQAADTAQVASRPATVPDPDTQVADIRRMLDEGRRADALHALKVLRRTYPHYDLPQDLRDLER